MAGIVSAFVAGTVSAHAPRQDKLQSTLLETLRDVQASEPGSDERAALDHALAALGAGAAPHAFDVLARSLPLATEDQPTLALDDAGEHSLYAALATWPEGDVARVLLARSGGTASLDQRLVALRILGRIGHASSMKTLSSVLQAVPPAEARHPLVLHVVEESVERILDRDGNAYRTLEDELEAFDIGVLPAVVNALGHSADWRGMLLLEQFLGKDSALDIQVLDAVSKLGAVQAVEVLDRGLDWVRERLEADDPGVRRQAAVAVGRLHDAESARMLIAALEDTDSRVRHASLWALREITGLNWEADTQRWRAWYRRERAWWADEAPQLFDALPSADRTSVAETLREFEQHFVFRDDLAIEIVPLLAHEDAVIATAATDALTLLASPKAVGPLIVALEDERRDELRVGLARGLESLTDESFGLDTVRWRAWYDALTE